MASKTWSSQAELQTWSWTNADLATVEGSVLVAAGQVQAVGVSPAYECANWTRWSQYIVNGTRPAGANYYLRFKVAETEAGLVAASWSEYIDGVDANGTIGFDLRTFTLNNPTFNVGPWVQLELTLETS